MYWPIFGITNILRVAKPHHKMFRKYFCFCFALNQHMSQFRTFTHLYHKINLSSVMQPNLSFPTQHCMFIQVCRLVKTFTTIQPQEQMALQIFNLHMNHDDPWCESSLLDSSKCSIQFHERKFFVNCKKTSTWIY